MLELITQKNFVLQGKMTNFFFNKIKSNFDAVFSSMYIQVNWEVRKATQDMNDAICKVVFDRRHGAANVSF